MTKKKKSKKETVNINPEEIAEKSSFWAFTGKLAIAGIVVGGILIYNGELVPGILFIIAAIGYVAYRLYRMKRKYG